MRDKIPMKIVSAAEMREIDRATSERFSVPSITLMENAGWALARFVLSDYPNAEQVAIVCGKGNNGGDGFAVARELIDRGGRYVFCCCAIRPTFAGMPQPCFRT